MPFLATLPFGVLNLALRLPFFLCNIIPDFEVCNCRLRPVPSEPLPMRKCLSLSLADVLISHMIHSLLPP